jgi:nucleotide-binding universal stress UspA family protein
MKKILIAADVSPQAEKVILKGVELANNLNAQYAVVAVTDDSIVLPEGNFATLPELLDNFREQTKSFIKTILDNNDLKPSEVFFESGNPADIVIQTTSRWQADVLVVGTHGRSGLDRLLIGSVAEDIIRQSSVPVFVVKF